MSSGTVEVRILVFPKRELHNSYSQQIGLTVTILVIILNRDLQ